MEYSIVGGKTAIHRALVTENGRLETAALTETEADAASLNGWKFNINTGDITLTNATKTTVLYVKNESDYPLVCSLLVYNLGATASGTGDVKIDVVRNPTTGDIITNTNNVLVGAGVEANQNFGSNNVMTGKFYKGASGETAVNGSVCITTRSASNTGRIALGLDALTIPLNSSIAIDYTPPASNSSQIVQFAMSVYERRPVVAAS